MKNFLKTPAAFLTALLLLLLNFTAATYAAETDGTITLRGSADGKTIELNWDADNSVDAAGYRIVWSRAADPVYPPRETDYYDTLRNPATDTYTIDYFLNTGVYYTRVCAFDAEETCLYYSNQLSFLIEETDDAPEDESADPDNPPASEDELPDANEEIPLTDIADHKNLAAISYLYIKGVISGYPDLTFRPDNSVNRAELLKILVGGMGANPDAEQFNNCFPDITDEWFAPYVCYAKTSGWVSGYPDGTFKPENNVNKAEAIKMLVNSQKYTLPAAMEEDPFLDVKTTDWFAPYIHTAKQMNLLEEIGSIYNPQEEETRAQISENIYRAMYVAEKELNSFPSE